MPGTGLARKGLQLTIKGVFRMSIYREYWAKAPSATYQPPQAGFQTTWVQRHLKQAQARYKALRAQFIKSFEIF